MGRHRHFFKSIVAAGLAAVWISAPALADQARLDELFAQLSAAESVDAGNRITREIRNEWSRSGSAAVDLLLQRGLDALEEGDFAVAVEHLTAAIDHAPDFAQAWHLRATAYYMTGDIGPALSDLGQALILEPRHFGAMQGVAVLLEEMGRRDEALAVFRAVLAIHPTAPDIQGAIGRLERALEGQDL